MSSLLCLILSSRRKTNSQRVDRNSIPFEIVYFLEAINSAVEAPGFRTVRQPIRLPASGPNIHVADAHGLRTFAYPTDPPPIAQHLALRPGSRPDARACARSARGDLP